MGCTDSFFSNYGGKIINVVIFLAEGVIFCYFNSGIREYFLNLKNSFFENQLKTKSNNNFIYTI